MRKKELIYIYIYIYIYMCVCVCVCVCVSSHLVILFCTHRQNSNLTRECKDTDCQAKQSM